MALLAQPLAYDSIGAFFKDAISQNVGPEKPYADQKRLYAVLDAVNASLQRDPAPLRYYCDALVHGQLPPPPEMDDALVLAAALDYAIDVLDLRQKLRKERQDRGMQNPFSKLDLLALDDALTLASGTLLHGLPAVPVPQTNEALYVSKESVVRTMAPERGKLPVERWLNHLVSMTPSLPEYHKPYDAGYMNGKTVSILFGRNNLFSRIPYFNRNQVEAYLNNIKEYDLSTDIQRHLDQNGYSISESACRRACNNILAKHHLADIPLYEPFTIPEGAHALRVMRRHNATNHIELVLHVEDWSRYLIDRYQMRVTEPTEPDATEDHFLNASQTAAALKTQGYPVTKKTVLQVFRELGSIIPATHPDNAVFPVETETGSIGMKRIRNNYGTSYLADRGTIASHIIRTHRLAEAKIPEGYASCGAICERFSDFYVDRDDIIAAFKQWQGEAPEKYKPFQLSNGLNAMVVYDRKNEMDTLYVEEDAAFRHLRAQLRPITREELGQYLTPRDMLSLPECRRVPNFERKVRARLKELAPANRQDGQGTGRGITIDTNDRSVRLFIKDGSICCHKQDIGHLLGAIQPSRAIGM